MDARSGDRALISDLVVAYSYAIDERDWAAFESLFRADAHIDYLSAGGIAGTPAEVAAWMPGAMALFTWTLHSISTHRIAFTGDREATGSLHLFARHALTWNGVDEVMDVSATYHDTYVETDDGWRFASRREETLLVTGGRFADAVAAGIRG